MAERDWGKRIVDVSRPVGVTAMVGALLLSGFSPTFALFVIEAGAATFVTGEIVGAGLERGRKS